MKIELAVPFVHLNGTSAERLIEALDTAWTAVDTAMQELRHCAPNGRDAYPVDGMLEKLEAQHRQRQECLQAVMDSLEAEIVGIQEAGK